jgi:hypothetical protein
MILVLDLSKKKSYQHDIGFGSIKKNSYQHDIGTGSLFKFSYQLGTAPVKHTSSRHTE